MKTKEQLLAELTPHKDVKTYIALAEEWEAGFLAGYEACVNQMRGPEKRHEQFLSELSDMRLVQCMIHENAVIMDTHGAYDVSKRDYTIVRDGEIEIVVYPAGTELILNRIKKIYYNYSQSVVRPHYSKVKVLVKAGDVITLPEQATRIDIRLK